MPIPWTYPFSEGDSPLPLVVILNFQEAASIDST